MLRLKQYFCKHSFMKIADHKSSSQSLWKCVKCGVHYTFHWGLVLGYKSKAPQIDGWVYTNTDL